MRQRSETATAATQPSPHVPCFSFFRFPVVRPARGGVPPTSARSGVREELPTSPGLCLLAQTEARSSGPRDTRRRQSPLRGAGSQDCTDGVNVSTPERPFPGDHLHRWTASRGALGRRLSPVTASVTNGRPLHRWYNAHETTPSTTAPDRRAGPQSRGETPR